MFIAKEFYGHLDIIEKVSVPKLSYPSAAPPMYTEIPNGLKARWKPFGCSKLRIRNHESWALMLNFLV